MRIIGAVDIGGTKIAVGAATGDGKIIFRMEGPTHPPAGFDAAMDRTKAMLHEVAERTGGSFMGIGVACPGPLDPVSGVIGNVGTLLGWQGGNLIAALKQEFNIQVAVENDADAGALAESKCGAGKGSSHLIYVTVSTGIGAGIVLAGELYRGARAAHPEIGHQIVDASSASRCYCKASGCWESLASGEAIATWMQEQQPVPIPLSTEDICHLAELGDPLAQKAMEREGYYLGLGLANLITVFAPDAVVLGGGVMKSSRLFLPRALKTIKEVCTQVPVENTTVSLATLGAETGLAGAALAWLSKSASSSGNGSSFDAPGWSVSPEVANSFGRN